MTYTYQTIPNNTTILRSDGAFIPPDVGNVDYVAYLAWVAAGNTAPSSLTLAQAQAQQIGVLTTAYQAAIKQPVSYTTKASVTETFPCGPNETTALSIIQLGNVGATALAAFTVYAVDGTAVAFKYADIQGLMMAISAQLVAAQAKLSSLTAQVNAAATVTAVQAITWT